MESGALSSQAFVEFAEKHVSFLHVTTHIPGRKDDDLLKRVGGGGFPTLLVLDHHGQVVARPRGRTVAAFRQAMAEGVRRVGERAALAEKQGAGKASTEEMAKEFLATLKVASSVDPELWMPRYLRVRDGLSSKERAEVELRLAQGQLAKNMMPALQLDLDSKEGREAVLALFTARRKIETLPRGAFGNRVVLGMMRWAEHQKDPVLFAELLEELTTVRVGLADNGFMDYNRQRLANLWKGLPPPERKVRPRPAPTRRGDRKPPVKR